ncbi:hypothetical protein RND81_09G023800 [Saponaria officinalis]|uniref:Retrovirus-related Pol polyprotein from transposon TNT 1-94-like beta-barrel domain-containing protein n=1 Tax=Saponaria officinalis TaxID=3572 RepID=A0AAW1IGS4_SAPOF
MTMAANKSYHFSPLFSKTVNPSNVGDMHQFIPAQSQSSSFNRDAKRSRPPLECDYCGKRGHTRAYCFKLKAHNKTKGGDKGDYRGRLAAHVEEVSYSVEDTPLGTDAAYDSEPVAKSGTNAFQFDPAMVQAFYQEVQKMMHNKGPDFTQGAVSAHAMNLAGMTFASHVETPHLAIPEDCWIVDSGASDHMTHNLQQFVSFRTLHKPLKVTLPDGSKKEVKIVGDVSLQGKILLKNVLYLPDFKHKLLSVGRVLDDSGLEANFTPTVAYSRTLQLRRGILWGKIRWSLSFVS